MASGGKRSGGERILESRHVIGLFLIMLLFSGIFFTLGYVMGRQSDGEVRASTNSRADSPVRAHSEATAKHSNVSSGPTLTPNAPPGTPPTDSGWGEFGNDNAPPKLEPAPKPAPAVPPAKVASPAAKVATPSKSTTTSTATSTSPRAPGAPMIPNGSYLLQVAAMTKEADAFDLATRLQKKGFPASVLPARTDKFYRVQVGPYPDQKSADAAKKGLDTAGFKAIVKR